MSGPGDALDGREIRSAAARAIAALPVGSAIDQALVVDITESTQDVARTHATPGLVVFAENQTKGRGRLGRQWLDIGRKSLAATFTLGPGFDVSQLSLGAGLAACLTIESFLPAPSHVGIRWPNDVVTREVPAGDIEGRKLAGVLIEAAGSLRLVGIGINVGHAESDWPQPLGSTACSLRQLGSPATRAQVAAALISHFVECLAMPPHVLVTHWRERNVLLGRHCGFVHDGRTHTGVVRDIDPANHIVLEAAPGETIRLPALTTSLLK